MQAPARGSSPEPPLAGAEWAVEAYQIVKRFGETIALAGVDLCLRPGEFFSLLGPSGCGKTTLLRIIAGLDSPDTGTLRLGGQDALDVPAHRRPVNTVFQSYALFPHLSVYDNVAFGLRMKGVTKADLEARTRRTLDLVEIARLQHRKPAQLSGGEKQRVALARALVNEPQLLLLDEPLGALDLKLRHQLQTELHQLQRRLGITFLYVTHDQDEALTLSDRIAVLNNGQVEQTGTGQTLYQNPRNRFVAQFLGQCNLLEGAVHTSGETDSARVETACGELTVHTNTAKPRLTLAIRPERIALDNSAAKQINVLHGTIREVIYSGAETRLRVEVGTTSLHVVRLNDTRTPSLSSGQSVQLHIPPDAICVLDD